MSKSRDPIALTAHWHVDCRIEADLPEDNVISTRFLINTVFGSVALAAVLYTGWLGYTCLNLRFQVHDWESRLSDNRAEMRDIQRMQVEYAQGATKVDQAWQLINPQFAVSDLIANIGRTRPEPMILDTIEWNDAGIFVRGSLHETPERATRILGDYVKLLGHDDKIAPLFREIVLTGFMRGASEDVHNYEIMFRFRPKS